MTWIDEMFVSMETDTAAAAAKRSANAARVGRTEHVKNKFRLHPNCGRLGFLN
jgi:hypothetical protein